MNYKLPPPNFEEWFRESVGVSFDGAKQRGAWDLKLIAEAFEAGRAYAIAAIDAQGVPDGVVLQIDAAVTQAQKLISDWNEWYGMHGDNAPIPPGGIVKAQEMLSVAKSLLASAPPAPKAKQCEWTNCPTRVGDKCCNEQASAVQQEPLASAQVVSMNDMQGVVDWLPHNGAPIKVGDYLYTHPAPQAKPQPLSDDRDARIAELEQRNHDLYEDVQRFKEHALNEKDARMVLERELSAARKDAERYRWLQQEHARHDPLCHLSWKKNNARNGAEWVNTAQLEAAIDAAMKGQQ